jgi:hypothetical protein
VVVLLAGALTTIVAAASVVALSPGTSGAAATWNPSTAPTTGLNPPALTGSASSVVHISSVSCATATSCVAVGYYAYSSDGPVEGELGLIEAGTLSNGTWQWTAQTAPDGGLDPVFETQTLEADGYVSLQSVSCGTATSCTAVGQYTDGTDSDNAGGDGIIESGTYSGGMWSWTSSSLSLSQMTNPPLYTGDGTFYGAAVLSSVSCSGESCVATGYYNSLVDGDPSQYSQPIILTNSSGSWVQNSMSMSLLSPALGPVSNDATPSLSAVSCSSSTECVAVGSYEDGSFGQDGMIVTGDLFGGEWSWVATNPTPPTPPSYYNFNAVSCPSSVSCVIAGQGGTNDGDLVETGTLSQNGWTWVINTIPTTQEFYDAESISCDSTVYCVIATGFKALFETGVQSGGVWTWTTASAPTGGLTPALSTSAGVPVSLSGVSCISTTCVGVGYYYGADGALYGLIETTTLPPTPTIDLVTPAGGPLDGANTVTIDGSGFEDTGLALDYVSFDPVGDTDGSEVIYGVDATVVSDSEITVTAPDATAAADGKSILESQITASFTDSEDSDVTVTSLSGSSDDTDYTFGAPVIDSIAPGSGPLIGGTTVTITGSGFEDAGLSLQSVDFDPNSDTDGSLLNPGTSATVVSDTEITVTAPDMTVDAAGALTLLANVLVFFTDPADGANPIQAVPATLGIGLLNYTFGVPVIDSVSPRVGPLTGGNTVTITGSGFQDGGLTLNKISFDPSGDTDGADAIDGTDAVVVSDTEMTVVAPDASEFAVVTLSVETVITASFTDGAEGGAIEALPASPSDSDYVFGVPEIDSISPGAGPLAGGNTVTITGSGFTAPGLSLLSVSFDPDSDTGGTDGIAGDDPVLVSNTEITVTAPDATQSADGQSTLDSDIFVDFTDAGGSTIQALPKTANVGLLSYTFGAPIIDLVSPASGALDGGNTVTITGSGFETEGLTLDTVGFDPTSDTAGSSIIEGVDATVVSDTEITVTAPDATDAADAKSLLETQVGVSFSDGSEGGTPIKAVPAATGDNDYTFGAPVIDSMTPSSGPLGGGNTLTITGSGFSDSGLNLLHVAFDPDTDTTHSEAIDGLNAVVVSDTEITVTVPDATAAAAGKGLLDAEVDVAFDNPDEPDTSIKAVPAATGDNDYTFGAPVLSSVAPNSGPLAGGNSVTITGSGFAASGLSLSAVTFDPSTDTDGSEALGGLNAVVVSDTEITVIAPDATTAAGDDGEFATNVHVSFNNSADPGTPVRAVATTESDSSYSFGAPVIDSVSPDNGPNGGGNTITITGAGFQDAGFSLDGVTFDPTGGDATPIDGLNAVVVSDSEITVTAPDVTAQLDGESSLATEIDASFTNAEDSTPVDATEANPQDDAYTFEEPQLDLVAPTGGPLAGGNVVTITGVGFQDAGLTLDTVTFSPVGGGDALDGTNPSVVSDTEITVTAPDATGAADGATTLDTDVGLFFTSSAAPDNPIEASTPTPADDTYAFGAPVLDSLSPDHGPVDGGNSVTITGSGFQDAGFTLDQVAFDPSGAGATPIDGLDAVVVSDTQITVTAPDATTAAGDDSNFATTVEVSFTDPSESDTPILAPPSAEDADVYTFESPVIDSISPSSGSLDGGNTITITGSGFQDAGFTLDSVGFEPTSDTEGTAPIAGLDAQVLSDTEITVTAPDASAAANGASSLATTLVVDFTDPQNPDTPFDAPAQTPDVGLLNYTFGAPVIDSLSPNVGPLAGGNTITITGSGFTDEGLTLSKVTFDPVGAVEGTGDLAATNVDVVSDTEITVAVPDASVLAGDASFLSTFVDVDFTSSSAPGTTIVAVPSSEADASYTYGAPTVSSLSPTFGSLSGGNTITITGTGFDSEGLDLDSVTFDPTSGADEGDAITGLDPVVVSNTEITVTAPDATADAGGQPTLETTMSVTFADTSDAGDTVVAQPANDDDALLDYTFGAPTVDSLDPASGALDGGNKVTITGTGFEDTGFTLDQVSFTASGDTGGDALVGLDPVVVSDTELTVTAPDATTAADGKDSLASTVTVSFTDAEIGGTPITADTGEGSDTNYLFGGPVITSVTHGGPLAGGNSLTITGSGFEGTGFTIDQVSFEPSGDTGGANALVGLDPVVISDTEITVTAPDATTAADGASTLEADVDVSFNDVATPGSPVDATPAQPDDANYTFGAPVIDALNPTGGPLTGTNTLTITGSGFESAGLTLLAVAFDPTSDTTGTETLAGTDARVISDTEITVVAPDATSAANGETTLETNVDVTFTNASDPATPVAAVPADAEANAYEFGAAALPEDVFTTQPPTTTSASSTFDVAVSVESGGDVVTGDNTDQFTLSITLSTGTPGAQLSCTSNPVTVTSGVAHFTCSLSAAGTGYTLTATSGLATTVLSNSFDVTPAAGPAPACGALENCTSGTNETVGGSATSTSTATTGSVTATAQGTGAITVGRYAADPVGAPSFSVGGRYFDVAISSPNTFTSLTINDCDLGGATSVMWWNPAANAGAGGYEAVSNEVLTGPPACIAITVNATSSPTLSQMEGTVFVGALTSVAPKFSTDTPPLTATSGTAYHYTFVATGTPSPTYALAPGAPSWLSIGATSGVVSATVPAGITHFTYSVVASNGVTPPALSGPFVVAVLTSSRNLPARIELVASANNVRPGGDVTLFAQVSGAFRQPTPSGTVSFSDNGAPIPGCTTLALSYRGQVSCRVSVSGALGSSQLMVATYSGDRTYKGASANTTVTVSKVRSIVLLRSSSNLKRGLGRVTYFVSVLPGQFSAGRPTGTVTLSDDSVVIAGCVNLALSSQATAVCTENIVQASGKVHQITASYSGDGTFMSSSASLSVVISGSRIARVV